MLYCVLPFFPSNTAVKALAPPPMGSQPAPLFQYVSPESAVPSPSVSKSRFADSS